MEHISNLLPKKEAGTPHTASESLIASTESNTACPICGDTYFLHPAADGKPDYSRVIRCACQVDNDRKEKWGRLLRTCRLPDGERTKTLDDFQTDGVAVLQEVVHAAQQFLAGEIIFLTLIAETNRGKSHIAKAIVLALLQRGIPARYGFVPDFLGELRAGFDEVGEDSFRYRLQQLLDIPVLVLDDLGTEKITAWGMEIIQRIVNHRYEHRLPLVVTTNRPLAEICGSRNVEEKLASARIASRLKREEWCRVVYLDAPSFDRRGE